MFDHVSEGVATVAAGAVTGLLAWLGGVRSGKAQFITAASTAADLMLQQQSKVITRMEGVIQRQDRKIEALKRDHAHCADALKDVVEQLAALRVAAQLPPWEPRPVPPPGASQPDRED